MDIFGANTLSNLGEIEIKPFSGYVGDSGLSRILYESETDHTEILTMIYESDFYELELIKKGLVTEAQSNFEFQINKIKENIRRIISEFISKISGWWDSFMDSIASLKSFFKSVSSISLEGYMGNSIPVSFTAGANVFSICDGNDIFQKSVGKIYDAKINGYLMDPDSLIKLDIEELKSLREYIKSDDGKLDMFGASGSNPQDYVKEEIAQLLGEQKQYKEVTKEQAGKILKMWADHDTMQREIKKAKDKHIKFCKQELSKFDKKSSSVDEKQAIVDQCMYEYFRLYREMILANCKIYLDTHKELLKVAKVVVNALRKNMIIRHESMSLIESLYEECTEYKIDSLFNGELV